MGARSAGWTAYDVDPSDLAGQTHAISNYFNMIKAHEANRVHAGGIAKDPTTGSSQLTGTGNTTWNVDIEAMIVSVGGVMKELAVQADVAIHSGSFLTGLISGASCIAAVVLKNVAGTVTQAIVKGTPATTGTQVAPTDAEIQTAVGAGNDWVKIAECTLNRTGDTTVTESQDNTGRPVLGVTVDTSFAVFTG
jgi:hypothetical protein